VQIRTEGRNRGEEILWLFLDEKRQRRKRLCRFFWCKQQEERIARILLFVAVEAIEGSWSAKEAVGFVVDAAVKNKVLAVPLSPHFRK